MTFTRYHSEDLTPGVVALESEFFIAALLWFVTSMTLRCRTFFYFGGLKDQQNICPATSWQRRQHRDPKNGQWAREAADRVFSWAFLTLLRVNQGTGSQSRYDVGQASTPLWVSSLLICKSGMIQDFPYRPVMGIGWKHVWGAISAPGSE